MQANAKPSFDVMGLLTQYNRRWTETKFAENQILYSQGDPADSVFYIYKGKIKVSITSERGKEAIVAIRGPRLLHQVEFADYFLYHLLNRTARVEADLANQLFNSSEMRLARALLLLAHYGDNADQEPILVKVSQETLAAPV
jgi:CRP/FNR family transcriptional regulator, cyclic AMP receptor protein